MRLSYPNSLAKRHDVRQTDIEKKLVGKDAGRVT